MEDSKAVNPERLPKWFKKKLTCGITEELYHTPVTLNGSGKTVEEDIAKQIFAGSPPYLCPHTRKPITGYDINYDLKELLDEYLGDYPNAKRYTPKEQPKIPAVEKKSLPDPKFDHEPKKPQPKPSAPPADEKAVANPQEAERLYQRALSLHQKDPALAVALFDQASALGHAGAQSEMGFVYSKGLFGVVQNDAKALEYYRLAVAQHNSGAQNNLGYMYGRGLGVEQNFAEAARLYRLSAGQGNKIGQTNLVLMIKQGHVSPPPVAEKTVEKSQEAEGLYQQALQLLKKDSDRGLLLLDQAACLGHASAQNEMGLVYENDRYGVAQNHAKALEYFRLAVAQNNSGAQSNLGAMICNGYGVKQDYTEAVRLFRLSAGQNNKTGQTKLEYCYKKGLVLFDPNNIQDYKADLDRRNIPEAFYYVNQANIYHNLKRQFDQGLNEIEYSIQAGLNSDELIKSLQAAKNILGQLRKLFEEQSHLNPFTELAMRIVIQHAGQIKLDDEKSFTQQFRELRRLINEFELTLEQEKAILQCVVSRVDSTLNLPEKVLIYITGLAKVHKLSFEKPVVPQPVVRVVPNAPPAEMFDPPAYVAVQVVEPQSDAQILASNPAVVSPIYSPVRSRSESMEREAKRLERKQQAEDEARAAQAAQAEKPSAVVSKMKPVRGRAQPE